MSRSLIGSVFFFSRPVPLPRPPCAGGRGGRRFPAGPARYRIVLDRKGQDEWTLVAADRHTGWAIFDWDGPVVHRLIDCGVLRRPTTGRSLEFCDKAFLQHLALAAASARMALERAAILDRAGIARRPNAPRERIDPLRARLDALGVELDGAHYRIARLLFEHPGHHFSQGEVFCLLELGQIPVRRINLDRWLDELADRRVIQRIEAAPGRVFYDVDTRPHLHIYDTETDVLRDAAMEGVISRSGTGLRASVRLVEK